MQIQVNTDHNVNGREALVEHVRNVVEKKLSRFSSRITRVEVHLNDENAAKSGKDDKRCMIEARVDGRKPTAVTDHAQSIHQAIGGAVDKLTRAIDSDLGRLRDSH